MKKIVVAIDGYSSCGKSTVAKALAKYAGYTYVDTGAMYRAVALAYQNQESGIKSQDSIDTNAVINLLPSLKISFIATENGQHVCLNGEDVEGQIRTLEIGNLASQISTIGAVRRFLVEQQQAMGREKGIVMDGRDIGTVVFPNAELKLFLTASPAIRAQRRFDELVAKGETPVFAEVLADVEDRDYRDTHRTESPLKQAEDAVVVDNSEMTREEQLTRIIKIFESRR